jgi:hypothetical protein
MLKIALRSIVIDIDYRHVLPDEEELMGMAGSLGLPM